ncbi:precorrin-6A/cobalt-precorrin-6A reductase [Eubacterium ruminantium]|uniref:precorrin-6A/cobalt-precorrin-6A reductase n=1 Tax=Eubacterium ruminantium TaxID=42322 RepID=UPI00247962D1|nr:precorrin-6A/cobalt-precorrin-6A reductase [Eubacterium ruminantium]
MNILIFGGTTEGRVLSKKLAEKKKAEDSITVCVASDYGEKMMNNIPVNIHVGRLDKDQMIQFIEDGNYETIIDATHPFATEVTENIKASCKECDRRYIRLKRDEEKVSGQESDNILYCNSCIDAAEKLEALTRDSSDVGNSCDVGNKLRMLTKDSIDAEEKRKNVLLTTGSKELQCFVDSVDVKKLYVRVIPSDESINKALSSGISEDHIIAMMGPFSEETNIEHIQKYEIKYLVTKESGSGSGFHNKISAASKEGVTVLVIRRPDDNGYSISEVIDLMTR